MNDTERMRVERLREDHLAEFVALYNDPDVAKTLGGARTGEWVRGYIATNLRHWDERGFGVWAFRDKESGEFVGRAGLRVYDLEGEEVVELLYALMPQYWNRGLATEMSRALVAWGFGSCGMDEIVAFTLPTNLGSRRVMEKAGFQYERDIIHWDLPHVLYRTRRGSPRGSPRGSDVA